MFIFQGHPGPVEGSNEDYCFPFLDFQRCTSSFLRRFWCYHQQRRTAFQPAIVHAVCLPSKPPFHPEFHKTALSIVGLRALTAARPSLPLSRCTSFLAPSAPACRRRNLLRRSMESLEMVQFERQSAFWASAVPPAQKTSQVLETCEVCANCVFGLRI